MAKTKKPRKFTARQVIAALEKTRGNQAAAGRLLGCVRQTVAAYIKHYPSVAAAYEQFNETMIDAAETRLTDNVLAGDQRAIEFYLRTKGRHRGYGDRLSIDFDPAKLSDEELEAIASGKTK